MTSIAEQASNFDHLYRSGFYERFGLCNYSPEEVSEWISTAKEKGFVLPSVYQGQYNILCRTYEEKLFPLLRKNHITFIANSPLAGGFLTGKVTDSTSNADLVGTRFEDGSVIGRIFRAWYDKPVFHEAVKKLQRLAESQHVTPAAAAMRWLLFHSCLKEGDAVIIGPSNAVQLDEYIQARKSGPLHSDMSREVGDLFDEVKPDAAPIVEVGWWTS